MHLSLPMPRTRLAFPPQCLLFFSLSLSQLSFFIPVFIGKGFGRVKLAPSYKCGGPPFSLFPLPTLATLHERESCNPFATFPTASFFSILPPRRSERGERSRRLSSLRIVPENRSGSPSCPYFFFIVPPSPGFVSDLPICSKLSRRRFLRRTPHRNEVPNVPTATFP